MCAAEFHGLWESLVFDMDVKQKVQSLCVLWVCVCVCVYAWISVCMCKFIYVHRRLCACETASVCICGSV